MRGGVEVVGDVALAEADRRVARHLLQLFDLREDLAPFQVLQLVQLLAFPRLLLPPPTSESGQRGVKASPVSGGLK